MTAIDATDMPSRRMPASTAQPPRRLATITGNFFGAARERGLAPATARGTMFANARRGRSQEATMKMLETMKMLTILVLLAASALILMAPTP